MDYLVFKRRNPEDLRKTLSPERRSVERLQDIQKRFEELTGRKLALSSKSRDYRTDLQNEIIAYLEAKAKQEYEEENPLVEIDPSRYAVIEQTHLKQFRLPAEAGRLIGEGNYAKVKNACRDSDCNYAVKILPTGAEETKYEEEEEEEEKEREKERKMPRCLSPSENARRELTIAKLMSDLGVGPHVFEMAFGPREALVVMELFDGTLAGIPQEYEAEAWAQAKRLIRKMHAAGIIHRDLLLQNILYKILPDGAVKVGRHCRLWACHVFQ